MKRQAPHARSLLAPLLLSSLLLAACGEKPETMLASAKDYLAKNDTKAAIIQIKNALQKDPNLGEARLLLGKALYESGDAAGAEVELKKAIELKVASDQAVPLLAKAMLAQGQFKKIKDDLAGIPLNDPIARADFQSSLATALAAGGDNEGAQKAVAQALAAQAEYAPAMLVSARLKASSRDVAGALAVVDRIIAKTPNDHEALKFRGDLLQAQGDKEQATVTYRKAAESRPSYLPAQFALIGGLIRQGKPEDAARQLEVVKKIAPRHPQAIQFEAQMAYQKRDFKTARELILQVLKAAPNNPASLDLAGAIEFQLRSYRQAEEYLSKALQASPDLVSARAMLVSTYLKTGQAAKALATLEPIVPQIGSNGTLLSLAGQTYLQNGDAVKAEGYFAKAASANPKDASKRTALAVSQLSQGKTEDAFAELERISLDDAGTTADMALIAAHVKRREFDAALAAIDRLEKKQANSPAPHQLRASVLIMKKDMAGARKSLERALQANPTFFAAVMGLAALDIADKKPDDAKKRFTTLIAAEPKNALAILALAELTGKTGGKPSEVLDLINKAVAADPNEVAARVALVGWHLQHNEPAKATAAAQDAAAALPDRPELLEVLGRAQQMTGDTNQALATYAKMAKAQPLSTVPHVRTAEMHAAAKNFDAAAQSLDKALAIRPDMLEAQRALIIVRMASNRHQDALAVAQTIQKQRPKEGVGHALEGDVYAARKDWAQAVAAYRKGLKIAPTAELGGKIYAVLGASGNVADAEKFAATWIKDKPKDLGFRLYLADVAMTRNEYESAARHYRHIIENDANNALVLNNLAYVAGKLKDPKAIEYAEKANQLAPKQPAVMDTLAMLLADKGDTARAIELLKDATTIAPQAAKIRLNYAEVLLAAGKKAEARSELEQLAKLGDKFPDQATVAKLQKSL